MLHLIISKEIIQIVNLRKKVRQLLAYIHNFKETHKSFFMKCAVIFMAVKIGIILLAAFSTMAFFLCSGTQYLALETSREKAMLFAFPLTMIIMLKLYFIFKMLMTYGRSKSIIKSAVDVLLLKGGQGMRRIEKTFPADLSPLSLEKT